MSNYINFVTALQQLYPAVVRTVGDTAYDISGNEVPYDLVAVQSQADRNTYKGLRQAEYPPLADLADALYHQSKGDETKLTAYLAKCEAVKQKYPKE
jgi:hypothetical protein